MVEKPVRYSTFVQLLDSLNGVRGFGERNGLAKLDIDLISCKMYHRCIIGRDRSPILKEPGILDWNGSIRDRFLERVLPWNILLTSPDAFLTSVKLRPGKFDSTCQAVNAQIWNVPCTFP